MKDQIRVRTFLDDRPGMKWVPTGEMPVPRYQWRVLAVAEKLHGLAVGHDEDWSYGNITLFDFLKGRLADWQDSSRPFDVAVKRVCELAVAEFETSWWYTGRMEELKKAEEAHKRKEREP